MKPVSETIALDVTISPGIDQDRRNTAVDSQREERNTLTEVLCETETSIAGGKRTSSIDDVPENENRHSSPNISCVSINIA